MGRQAPGRRVGSLAGLGASATTFYRRVGFGKTASVVDARVVRNVGTWMSILGYTLIM